MVAASHQKNNLSDLLVTNCPESSIIGYSPIHSISTIYLKTYSDGSVERSSKSKYLIASNFDRIFSINLDIQEDLAETQRLFDTNNPLGEIKKNSDNLLDTFHLESICESANNQLSMVHKDIRFLIQAPKNTQIYSMSYDSTSKLAIVSFRLIKTAVPVEKRSSESDGKLDFSLRKTNSDIISGTPPDSSESTIESIHIIYRVRLNSESLIVFEEHLVKEFHVQNSLNTTSGPSVSDNPLITPLPIGSNKSKIFSLQCNDLNGELKTISMCAIFTKFNNSINILQIENDLKSLKIISIDKQDKVLDFGAMNKSGTDIDAEFSGFEFYIVTSRELLTYSLYYK
ncbi:hypothetical protein AYI68_g3493 [Smittium mucronatum]|uniref:Uncharacterized protein n=1 Tax=Smittium mucronatum TaxID=133383 RepID=A0A1R0GZY7_9FUNG|nr:hypothetical protein AYI68_g3493 [Smittium mucronatum]